MPDTHPDILRALSGHQRKVARKIVRIGERRGESNRKINSALATGLVETRLRNLRGGDADSVNWRQERASIYGGDMSLKRSINRYYNEADQLDRGQSPGELAADVQRPAAQYRGRYATEMDEARSIRRAFSGGGAGVAGMAVGRPQRTEVSSTTETVPGQSFAPERAAARQQLLLGGDINLKSLLAYKAQTNSLQDVPSRQVRGDIQVRRTPAGVRQNDLQVERRKGGPRGTMANTSRTLNEMFNVARRVDQLNNKGQVQYLWGGGHGATHAAVGEDVDCSGFVSQVLGIAPRVSGDFAASWGKPGEGKWVTVYANPTHVLMKIRDPKTKQWRWFGTSRSNPGGGAGEIAPPSAEYLSGFTKRRPGGRRR